MGVGYLTGIKKWLVWLSLIALAGLLGQRAPFLSAADAAPKSLLEMSAEGVERHLKASSNQVTFSPSKDSNAPGINLVIQPGQDAYPGVTANPHAPWNLSEYGHVVVRLINTGDKPIRAHVRIDNDGDWRKQPWNSESASLKAGETQSIKVLFGYSNGMKFGYPLDRKAVVRMLVFVDKANWEQRLRIESIAAGGPAGEQPPRDPKSIRIKPEGGYLFGEKAEFEAALQLDARNGATAALGDDGRAIRLNIPSAKSGAAVMVKPALGRWDLREYLQVRITIRNAGDTPVTPRVRLESDPGPSGWAVAREAIAPGAIQDIVVPFAATTPRRVGRNTNECTEPGEQNEGASFGNDAVSGVMIGASGNEAASALSVLAVRAELPPPAVRPAWLGKRPPVEGDWVMTFNEEFNSNAIDGEKWSIYGENYWDKKSHFSKDNVILRDGVVRLRYEKKRGFHNDDPNGKLAKSGERESDYATGFLQSYGKWVQRYGYFEARMKLPTAPGLWPAFWLMPERGVDSGPQWKRQDTGNGGMEFDVMEHLTRWGPHRYSVAMHWDGYDKGHKQTGADSIYVRADRDGFITAGLLWLPRLAVFYANGREVARWECDRISNVPSEIMFTLPMGGWDNNALDDARLPDDFVIDYVRAWQRRDLATTQKVAP